MVAQAAAHRLIARKPLREATMRSGRLSIAIAGCNDEVGRTDESTKQVHMTWVEDATMSTRTSNVFNETSLKSMSRGGVREEHA